MSEFRRSTGQVRSGSDGGGWKRAQRTRAGVRRMYSVINKALLRSGETEGRERERERVSVAVSLCSTLSTLCVALFSLPPSLSLSLSHTHTHKRTSLRTAARNGGACPLHGHHQRRAGAHAPST